MLTGWQGKDGPCALFVWKQGEKRIDIIVRMDRAAAHRAIAEVYRDMGFSDGYWTADTVAEAEQRLAIDDADRPDSTAVALEFALRVLDKLEILEPYAGPGDHHW